MSLRLGYRAEAFADIAEAFSWYQERRPGLGWEFEAALHDTLTFLRQAPEAGPVVHRSLRRALLPRFPYAIYYSLAADVLEVRGVLHTRGSPKRWRSRA